MNKFDEKAAKMKTHLAEHPTDYQTVVSLFKVESDSIAYEQRKSRQFMMREVAKYKRVGEIDGKQTEYRRAFRGLDPKLCSDCQCGNAR